MHPPEDSHGAQIPLRLRDRGGIVGLSRAEEELTPNDARAGSDVQAVRHTGEPTLLVGIEDVPPLELDAPNDQAGIGDRTCVCLGLGRELERKQACRERQKVPKVQQKLQVKNRT